MFEGGQITHWALARRDREWLLFYFRGSCQKRTRFHVADIRQALPGARGNTKKELTLKIGNVATAQAVVVFIVRAIGDNNWGTTT